MKNTLKNIKNSLLPLAIGSVLSLTLSGCIATKEAEAIKVYNPEKTAIKLSQNINAYVSNGALVETNGNKVYDELGDIQTALSYNNKTYYLLKVMGTKTYQVKSTDKKVIKSIDANELYVFKDNNETYFAVKLIGNNSKFIDNIYKFEGNKLSLINKNVNFEGTYSGMNVVLTSYQIKDGYYYFIDQTITNIKDGTTTSLRKDIKTNYDTFNKPYIIGTKGDLIYYAYSTGGMFNKTDLIEVYNRKTKEVHSLTKKDEVFQILVNGSDAVLKIFNNKVKRESRMHGHVKGLQTEHVNEQARLIHLNTLKEISSISDKYQLVHFYGGFMNAANRFTPVTYITVDASDLVYILIKNNNNGKLAPLF